MQQVAQFTHRFPYCGTSFKSLKFKPLSCTIDQRLDYYGCAIYVFKVDKEKIC